MLYKVTLWEGFRIFIPRPWLLNTIKSQSFSLRFIDIAILSSQLIHSKVVDTSVVFPHRLGPPYKRALRNLMADYLKKIIQDSGELSKDILMSFQQ